MPDPITWGALAKAIGDNTLVSEEIATLILDHNLDPSAHGQSNEAVYNHRISELLDHVSYSIYNAKINPASRVYQAIVGDGLSGDFSGLQEAIDWTHLYGGGRILIKKGTYHIPGTITLYSDIILEGEDSDLSILDFDQLESRIEIIGTSGTHKHNVEVRNLQILNCGYYDYGAIYMLYADDCQVIGVKFDNVDYAGDPITNAVFAENSKRLTIEACYLTACDRGFTFMNCDFVRAEFNYMTNVGSNILYIYSSPNIIFRHNNVYSCGTASADSMIYFSENSNNLVIDSNIFESCKANVIWCEIGSRISVTNNVFTKTGAVNMAISVNDVDRSIFSNNRIYGFDTDGIYFADACDYCTIVGNVITNCGGYGINIDAATDDKNVVTGNALNTNTSGAIHNLGTGTVIGNNSA